MVLAAGSARWTRWSTRAAVVAAGAASAQCRAATDVRIATYSEVDCGVGAHVALVVARDAAGLRDAAPSAVSTRCAPAAAPYTGKFDMGRVVVAPASAADEPVAFAVMTRKDSEPPDSCLRADQAPSCIVITRQLRFAPHEELSFPIVLPLSCIGVVCPAGQTCSGGACVSDLVPPTCTVCTEQDLPPSSAPACGAAGGLQANAPWPAAGFCATRPGRSGRNGPQSPTIAWTFDLGGIASMSPAVAADGTIYAGSNAATVFAVDASGHEKWRAPVGNNVNKTGFVVAADGTVIVGSADANVYAFSPAGAERWATPVLADVAFTVAAGGDGTIYVNGLATAGGVPLFALSPASGAPKWKTAPTFGAGAPALGPDGTIYAGGVDAALYALRPSDGATVWRAATSAPPATPSVAADGTIYVTDAQALYAFTPSGARAWSVPLDAPADGVTIAGDGTLYVGTHSGKLLAVGAGGARRWTLDVGGGWTEPGVVGGDGTLYMGADDGGLYAITPEGKVRFRAATGGSIESQPAIGADGTLYVTSSDGKLYAIGP